MTSWALWTQPAIHMRDLTCQCPCLRYVGRDEGYRAHRRNDAVLDC